MYMCVFCVCVNDEVILWQLYKHLYFQTTINKAINHWKSFQFDIYI